MMDKALFDLNQIKPNSPLKKEGSYFQDRLIFVFRLETYHL